MLIVFALARFVLLSARNCFENPRLLRTRAGERVHYSPGASGTRPDGGREPCFPPTRGIARNETRYARARRRRFACSRLRRNQFPGVAPAINVGLFPRPYRTSCQNFPAAAVGRCQPVDEVVSGERGRNLSDGTDVKRAERISRLGTMRVHGRASKTTGATPKKKKKNTDVSTCRDRVGDFVTTRAFTRFPFFPGREIARRGVRARRARKPRRETTVIDKSPVAYMRGGGDGWIAPLS